MNFARLIIPPFLLLLFMLAGCSPQSASVQAVVSTPFSSASLIRPSKSTRILYSRALPKSVLTLMPHGARSMFYGTFLPSAGSKPMAIHVFARYPKSELVSKPESNINPIRHFALDIFEQHQNQFIQIKHTLITFHSSVGWGPILISAKLFWLDIAQKQPLLVIESFTKDGYFSEMPYGEALFIPFVKGWRGGTSLQTSNFGASNNDSKYYWMERASDGLLQIRRDDGSMNAGADAQGNDIHAVLIFKWKKRRFVVTPDTARYLWPQDKQFKP